MSFFTTSFQDVSVYLEYQGVDSSFTETLMQLDSGESQGKTKPPQPQTMLISAMSTFKKLRIKM